MLLLDMPSASPGLSRSGHYTITITQTGTNTSDGFTLVETAAVDYDLSVNPSSEYSWDATVAFEYDFTRGTTTLAGTNSFTSHVEGTGNQIIVDGGVWGGVGGENDANPFSFGFYNYNFGHFSIAGNWLDYRWDETGYGYHNSVFAGTEASSTLVGSQATNSDFSVWASAYDSNSFSYHLAGSRLAGVDSIGTYSLHATGNDSYSSAAVGSVVTGPTAGAVGDSVSASYEYQSSGSDQYTVSQWGTSATASYSMEDHGSVSSSLHTQATGTFQSVVGTTNVTGTAAYASNDSRQGTVTAVGGGSYDFGTRTGNDTVSASASANATFDSNLTVRYVGGGTGSYTATENAGYSYTATVRGSDSYSASGSGSSLTASVTAQSVTFTTSASGTDASSLTATFTGATTGTESSVWGLSLTNAYAFSDQVTGRDIGTDVSAANVFSETGNYWYSLSVTSTATSTGAASTGGTDASTVTRSASLQTSSSYSLSGTGHNSQWVSGTNSLSSADTTVTLNGTGADNDRQIVRGHFTHTNTSAPADNSSATFSYSATSSDSYSYHADYAAIQTPTTLTQSETYTATGTNSVSSTLSLSYSFQGTGTYLRGDTGRYADGLSLTGGDSSAVGPGGLVAPTADHQWVTYSATASGTETVSGSATYVADPTIRLERWGYSFTDAYQFNDTATGTAVDQSEYSVNRSTETGSYSYSLSVTSTNSVSDGNTGTDRTTEFAAGTNAYTTTETATFSQWVGATATLSRTTDTATYSGTGGDTATTYQYGEKTHAPTTADPSAWSTSYSYTGSDTGSYSYSGGSNDLSDGATSTYYSADSVTETSDGTYTWRKGGRTLTGQETDSFTLTETGSGHIRDQLSPTYSASGTATGQYTPYIGTQWGSGSVDYSLTIVPAPMASPTSIIADYWKHETETNSATYSGTVARGTYGDTQFHHDHETEWQSGTYTTSEHGTPAPDAPPGSGGGGGTSGGGSSSGSSTSGSSSVPSTYTLTAHGGGQLLTVRTDDELWQGAESATLVTSSMTVVVTGDGNDTGTLTETYAAQQNWFVPFTAGPPTVTNVGGVSGTKAHTITEGDNYTLSASQNYLVSGTTVASGTDTYSLHSSDTTIVRDSLAGTASGTVMPVMFNTAGGSTFGTGPGGYTTSLAVTDNVNYTLDRVVTSGYSWAQGLPTGSAIENRTTSNTISDTQTLSIAKTGFVTVGPGVFRPAQMATVVQTNQETRSATEADTYAYSGTFVPQTHTTSATQSWGGSSVTLHADQYLPLIQGNQSKTLAALSDKRTSDTHSATWTWALGVGGNASEGGTITYREDQTFSYINREITVGHTMSSSMTNTTRDDYLSNVRRIYTVPPTLTSASGTVTGKAFQSGTTTAVGYETNSATASSTVSSTSGSGFGWSRDYSSQTFTVHTTETPSVTQTTQWRTGVDDHQNSASNTATGSTSTSSFTTTHTFTLTKEDHRAGTPTTTQDFIDNRDYQSAAATAMQRTLYFTDYLRADETKLATASLSEYGFGTMVAATRDTSGSLTLSAQGGFISFPAGANGFTQNVRASDVAHEIKTTLASGQTQTHVTSTHTLHQYVYSGAFPPPGLGGSKQTFMTVDQNSTDTLTTRGTTKLYEHLFEYSLSEVHTFYRLMPWYNMAKEYNHWRDVTNDVTILDVTSWIQNYSQFLIFVGEADDAWTIFAASFAAGALDAAEMAITTAILSYVFPGSWLLFAWEVYAGIAGIKFGFDFGQSLYALGTGTDPKTGRELSKREYAELAGGVLGGLVGGFVGAKVGARIGEMINGERCGFLESCFAAGTPLRTSDGSKPIEQIRVGDFVLSRNEHRPDGPVDTRVVEEVFVRTGRILHLHVGGQVIRTTPEHPFYACDEGWVAAASLEVGDRLLSENGDWITVEDVFDTGEYAQVYNLRVAHSHTYFVGEDKWGFAAWAHNICKLTETELQALAERYRDSIHNGTTMDWGGLSRRQKSYVKDLAYELYGVEAATGPRRGDAAAHNAEIREIANEINASGHGEVVAGGRLGIGERVIKTPDGFLNSRRPDIIVRLKDGTQYGINVGLEVRPGVPVPREIRALADLNGPGGLPTVFIPYGLRSHFR